MLAQCIYLLLTSSRNANATLPLPEQRNPNEDDEPVTVAEGLEGNEPDRADVRS